MPQVQAEPPAAAALPSFGRSLEPSFTQPVRQTRNRNRAGRVVLYSRPMEFTSGRHPYARLAYGDKWHVTSAVIIAWIQSAFFGKMTGTATKSPVRNFGAAQLKREL